MNPFTLKPCGNNIIIRPDELHQPKGGIVIPGSVQKITNRGVVVATGPGERLLGSTDCAPTGVKEGDRVMFGKLHAYEFDEKGERLVMVNAREILAVENNS